MQVIDFARVLVLKKSYKLSNVLKIYISTPTQEHEHLTFTIIFLLLCQRKRTPEGVCFSQNI
jgi:hypothetical protein